MESLEHLNTAGERDADALILHMDNVLSQIAAPKHWYTRAFPARAQRANTSDPQHTTKQMPQQVCAWP
ncbi:MAG: hypothetical protein M5U05_18590, partial [Anaerolineales bacterium]|nr:hypothetical protein [Anaerolineales bacterium]